MAGVIARALVPLIGDLLRPKKPTAPDFVHATWVIGKTPGTLINADPIRVVGLNSWINDAHAWRIEYVTTDSQRRLVSATGVVFRSLNPWQGAGLRPTIAVAPSTQGMACHCNPSYTGVVGLEFRRGGDIIPAYEQPIINLMLASGAHVVVTDYPRSPEGNIQFYCDHEAAAHALADAVRAASAVGVGHDNLGLWGFSQGGGAVAAWLERPEYAPDLQLGAAVVGAPPAEMLTTLDFIDGGLATAIIAFAAAGLAATVPEANQEVRSILNPQGEAILEGVTTVCLLGAVRRVMYQSTSQWTKSGRSLADLFDDLPVTGELLEARRLGSTRPLIPVRLWSCEHDEIVPYPSVAHLARSWGVELQTRQMIRIPGRTGINHFLPYFRHAVSDIQWLLSRLGR